MDSADKWISPFAFKLRVAIDNKSNIPHLPFNCSYASSVINKMRNPLTICGIRLLLRIPQINFADSTQICGFHLHFAKSTYSCGIQNNQLFLLLAESATKQMGRQKLRYRNTLNFICGIHLHLRTYFKTCFWTSGTYRHKIVLLSSAQFGLVM